MAEPTTSTDLEKFKSEIEDTCGAIVSAGLDNYEDRLNKLDGKVKYLAGGVLIVVGLVVIETKAVVKILQMLQEGQKQAEAMIAAQQQQAAQAQAQVPYESKADYDPGPQEPPAVVKAVLGKTKEVIPTEPVE